MIHWTSETSAVLYLRVAVGFAHVFTLGPELFALLPY